jgi:S-adenosylmethionine hydrolase
MPLITLTTDFGQEDHLVGAVKGQLLKIDPAFRLIDISHSIAPFNYSQASYAFRNAYHHFPSHTFHFLLVNMFEQKPAQMLLAFYNDQYILCPDNGLIGMVLDEKPDMLIGLPVDTGGDRNTLVCTKVLGEAVKKIVDGESLHHIGIPDPDYMEKTIMKPWISNDLLEVQILYIDRFENVIVNITREEFEAHRQGRNFRITFKRNDYINKISETYSDVPEGDVLALFNAAGYLEIAINKGNAAGLLGLQNFTQKSLQMRQNLFYQTVKIHFF